MPEDFEKENGNTEGIPASNELNNHSDVPEEKTEESDNVSATPEEIPEETAPISEDGDAQKPAEVKTQAAPVYQWTYVQQRENDRKTVNTGKGGHGARNFAVIMAVMFLVSILILIAVLIIDGGSSASTVDESEMIAAVNSQLDTVVGIVARTETSQSSGTGIILSEDGYILTNAHVVEGAQKITVYFYDGSQTVGECIGQSELNDVALVKVKKRGLHPATLGNSDACVTAETVFAIGCPAGLDYSWTVTKGIVSYPGRYMRMYNSDGSLNRSIKVIQTDVPVNHGNSGGPLLNAKGEVIGMISMKLGNDYENMGFALPINEVMQVADYLLDHGNDEGLVSPIVTGRAVLGITGVNVTEGSYFYRTETGIEYVEEDKLDQYSDKEIFHADHDGIFVSEVTEGTSAYNVLKTGDILVMVNGVEVTLIYDIWTILNSKSVGESISVGFYRNGEYKTSTITLIAG